MKYSIAIRTLGTSGDKFLRELESIKNQTVQPDKVIVYIAQGYKRPDFSVGKEKYIWVKKGMTTQRVLSYDEIDTPLILFLDDDVELACDSAEKLIKEMENHHLDCIAADTFNNHRMTLKRKVYAAVTNLVLPHYSDKWAIKIHCNGSFSYNNKVKKDVYLSQSAAGPASLWRKKVFINLHMEDELWIDKLDFAYGEDALIFNKLYKNGFRLGLHYKSGIKNLDAKSSSSSFQHNQKKFYTRAKASFLIWYRTCFNLTGLSAAKKLWAITCFSFKTVWLLFIHIASAVFFLSPKIVYYYVKGIVDGFIWIKSDDYQHIPNYILS